MWNLPNLLSLIRLPLAFLFMPCALSGRLLVLLLALLSDGLDGYVARRYHQMTKLGTLLDPIMDKFFVGVVMTVLWYEGILPMELGFVLLSRDIAVVLYGVYLLWQGRLTTYRVHAIWSGKVMTCLQFVVFFSLLFHYVPPLWMYGGFVVLGITALGELYATDSGSQVLSHQID